jgi:hypothetical protein
VQFANPFSQDEITATAAVATTKKLAMDALMWGVDAYVRFMKEYVPVGLKGRDPDSLRERAVLDIYTAICGFLVCIYRLRGEWHVQGVAACSRSIFELYCDLLLLTQDSTELTSRRYHAFLRVEHLRTARKRSEFFLAHPEAIEPEAARRLGDFIAREGPAIDAEAKALWDHAPHHWSGIRSMESRAREAGPECESLYFQHYSILSWFVHTAAVGTIGVVDADGLKGQVARALLLVREIVPSTFELVATELGLDIPDLSGKVAFLRQVFFLRLVALKLGDPQRFTVVSDRAN